MHGRKRVGYGLDILTFVDHFEFVDVAQAHGYLTPRALLRRTSHPVNPFGQRIGAVCLDLYEPALVMEQIDQHLIELQRGFASGDDYVACGILPDCLYNLRGAHQSVFLVAGVAESAFQIAAAHAQKHRGSAREVALALKRIEDFVYPVAHRNGVVVGGVLVGNGLFVSLVACHVALAFLHVHAVAVGNLLADPAGNVLGRGVEGEKLVEIAVVEIRGDVLLDVAEIGHHPVGVELARTAVDSHNPVVAVQAAAFAFI